MPRVRTGIVELEYEEFGDPTSPAFLLTGLSTSLDDLPVPDLDAVFAGQLPAPYTLSDMADDAIGLLDGLTIERAHVVGISMGGMIAQTVAVEHPERVLSLTSIMSNTGSTDTRPNPETVAALALPPPADRAAAIENIVRIFRLVGSAEMTDAELRERATAGFDRADQPAGMARQVAAIVAAPDRTPRLRELGVPTLVVHGESDPMLDVSAGRATAAAIPGAELITVPGMGHDLPPRILGTIIEAIVRTTSRA